jgi:hypothetical protein
MLHGWVAGPSHTMVTRPHVPADRLRAARLTVRRDTAWRRVQRAMVAGDWQAAATWEERLVVSEHELALLDLERGSATPRQDQR